MTCYVEHAFKAKALERIGLANEIIEEYRAQGFLLTLRQLYYQLVARDVIANTLREYKKLGNLVKDARLAGLIDMDAIEDRTRGVREVSTWDDPNEILATCAEQFRYDKWKDQPCRVECWFEKDALAGVFEHACDEYDVPRVSTRGYGSLSLVYEAYVRFARHRRNGQAVVILHFCDHDPSGLDMTDDITKRFGWDCFGSHVEVERIALNLDQVEEYSPPPNYAKATDSRHFSYVRSTGTEECWELDALSPTVLAELVRGEVEQRIDLDQWQESVEREAEARAALRVNADNFEVGS
jgi:hypothetical protein